jgi:membrane protein YdbS with pleckstrin-like domain
MESMMIQDEPDTRLDRRAVSYWRLSGAVDSLLVWMIPVAYLIVSHYWQWPIWITIPLAALALAYSIADILLVPGLRWNTWRYRVSNDQIELRHGILVRRYTIIPMVRVQHVDTEQGPILRHYGLSAVKVSTAAGTHTIPALADDMAVGLRDRISGLARVVEEDV